MRESEIDCLRVKVCLREREEVRESEIDCLRVMCWSEGVGVRGRESGGERDRERG